MFGSASGADNAQNKGCSLDNFRCLEELVSSHCYERGTDLQSCQAFAAELQSQHSVAPTTELGEALGLAHYRLSEITDAASARAAYRESAREIFLDVVSNDESASGAYLMLSAIDHESLTDSIAWLRKSVATDQSQIAVHSLTSNLLTLGTPAAISEALDVVQGAYSNAKTGPEKWRQAAYVYDTYKGANLRFPGIVSAQRVDRFASRVRRDSSWNAALRTLNGRMIRPASVFSALETVCSLAGVFGEEPCIQSAEAVVEVAISSQDSEHAQRLADAAASGMKTLRGGACMVNCVDSRALLTAWLEQLSSAGLDSLMVLDAIATISPSWDQRLETRREIVARDPNSGQAQFELGKEYFDQNIWAEAITHFEIARGLLPPDDAINITAYLRQANYEVDNIDEN